jgi:hypothetical protein
VLPIFQTYVSIWRFWLKSENFTVFLRGIVLRKSKPFKLKGILEKIRGAQKNGGAKSDLHAPHERFCGIIVAKKWVWPKMPPRWSEHWAKREIFDHFTPPRFAKRRRGGWPRQEFF